MGFGTGRQRQHWIYTIGEVLFSLVWTNYFDDFPQLHLKCCQDDSQQTAERLLGLLGWKFSLKPQKRLPFSESFDALGVTFDFSSCHVKEIRVKNKEARILQVQSEIIKFDP